MVNRETGNVGRQPGGSRGKVVFDLWSPRRSLPQATGAVVILVGCSVLLGWALDIEVLKRVFPGLVAMNPATAVAFVLAGVSLLLLGRAEAADKGLRRVGRGLGLAVALMGLLKLIGVLFGWEVGIDELPFGEELEAEASVTGTPNRMAPNTALNFFLLGGGLVLLDGRTRRGHWPAQYPILAAGAASLLTLIGYAYGVGSFYGVASYIPMALHTALAFLVLVVGLLCARPERGPVALLRSDTTGGVMARRLLPAAVLIPLVLGWLRLEGEQAGLYDTELGVAIMVVAGIAILAAFVAWNTRLLHRTDAERKRAEEEIRRLNETLEERVAERTARLEATVAELKESEERFRLLVEGVEDHAIFMLDPEGRVASWNLGARRTSGYEAEEIMGEHLSRFYTPEDVERGEPERALEVAEAQGCFKGEGWQVRKDGSRFWASVLITALRDEETEELKGFSKVTHDITERKRNEDLQRFFAEAGEVLSSSLDPHTTLANLARLAVPHLADWCIIDVADEDGSLERVAVVHQDPEKVALAKELEERYPPDPEAERGVARVLRTGEPELLSELPASVLDEAAVDAEHRRILHGLGLASYVIVPLVARGRTLGAITLVTAESGRRYGEADLEVAEDLARRAALAVDNARLYEEAQKEIAERKRAEGELAQRERRLEELVGKLITSQEEERRRVAYEIHDGLTQTAFSAHQHLQAFARYHPPSSEEAQEELGWVLELVKQTVKEARGVIAGLRPTELDKLGLAAALPQQVKKLKSEGWQITFEENLGDKRLPSTLETALYRVAQQALANTQKHAKTRRVRLSLKLLEDRQVRLRVRDWGRGFDAQALTSGEGGPGERVGLASMRERVTLLGGEFEVKSKPGAGTLVVAKVPLRGLEKGKDGVDDER